MIKLILTDLDETLIHYGLDRATDNAIAAIHRAQAAGVHFAAITGRAGGGLRRAFAGDPACTSTAAVSNGQIVMVDGQVVDTIPLDYGAMQALADALLESKKYVLNIIARPETPNPYRVVVNADPATGRLTYPTDSSDVRMLDRLPEEPIVKANVHVLSGTADLAAAHAYLQSLTRKVDFVSPGPQVPMFDIVPAGWSKASGAEVLRRHLGVAPDEVAAFGDAENDLPMIELYPNSVAVANSTPEVARAAGWHIGASADDAVADAIAQIADAAPKGRMPAFMSEEENARGLSMREKPTGERKVESLPIFHERN